MFVMECSCDRGVLQPVDRGGALPGRVKLLGADNLALLKGKTQTTVHGHGILGNVMRGERMESSG